MYLFIYRSFAWDLFSLRSELYLNYIPYLFELIQSDKFLQFWYFSLYTTLLFSSFCVEFVSITKNVNGPLYLIITLDPMCEMPLYSCVLNENILKILYPLRRVFLRLRGVIFYERNELSFLSIKLFKIILTECLIKGVK